MAAVGLPCAEGSLCGALGMVGEVVLAPGGAIEEDAGSDRGGDDEIGYTVGKPDTVGDLHVSDFFHCHCARLGC